MKICFEGDIGSASWLGSDQRRQTLYGVVSIYVSVLPLLLFTSDVYALWNPWLYLVTWVALIAMLRGSYDILERSYRNILIKHRTSIISSRGIKVQRQEQFDILNDTLAVETIACALFVVNIWFFGGFIHLSGWILPQWTEYSKSVTFALSTLLPATSIYFCTQMLGAVQ